MRSRINPILAEIAASVCSANASYAKLASVLRLQAIYRDTEPVFSTAMRVAYNLDITSNAFNSLVERHAEELDSMINEERDGAYSYESALFSSSLSILARTYMLKTKQGLIERPQYLFLRVAIQMYGDNLDGVRQAYELMSSHKYLPSSTILMNSGTIHPGLTSSYNLPLEFDHHSLFDSLNKVSVLSKSGAGVGLGMSGIPAQRSLPDGTSTPGLISFMKLTAAAIEVVDQGQLARPTAINASVEIWHADILPFILTRKFLSENYTVAKVLFQSVWINDLFMRRVAQNEDWTLFCPSEAPRLVTAYGEEFKREYLRLETSGVGARVVRAQDVWKTLLEVVLMTNGPAIMFKDATNEKSNQEHLGTILQSGVCMENAQFSDDQETAVSMTASVVLPSFVTPDGTVDYGGLEFVTRHLVVSLTRLHAEADYPAPSAKASAYSHRALGIGAQGLADTFALLGAPFDSPKAKALNSAIYETIYYAALDESCNQIGTFGPHPSSRGSHASRGTLQFDLWEDFTPSGRYDWEALKVKVKKGMANSLLTASMPTSGTSQITGFTDGMEPFASLAKTKVLPQFGRTTIFQGTLVDELANLGLWDDEMRERILSNDGSIQGIPEIPLEIRDVYRTCWELDPGTAVRLAADRGPYTCQSQSTTLYVSPRTVHNLSRQLYHAWWAKLKTGLASIMTRPIRATPMNPPPESPNSDAKGDDDSSSESWGGSRSPTPALPGMQGPEAVNGVIAA
ncbi:ribonucleotide reductase [Ephemerocybe angulata]|uniref:Ribonucleoside-diphosphate reductase n=1 Tax=Ephemerocybe angulata TaxID=980116 RepID=A0A8H6HV91_9AGAR|nr:ribonucleotide reductase [Tulosesus angulatus]